MNKTIKFFITAIIILVAIFSYRCAKIGTISGGPKDTTPPKMEGSTPTIYSKGFKGNRLRIDFDEFIQLKDLDKEFNVSPPLKKNPKIWVNGKSLIIQYPDTLLENTTYTFSFGNSIVDNNEGNILENFSFVFSTGKELDSLGIYGSVVDAFNATAPKERILVTLFENLADSAPLTSRPLYTARINKEGFYHIRSVKPGKYRLYAYNDKNFNYRYDRFSENFAFYDSIIELTAKTVGQHLHLYLTDTLHKETDSTLHATIDSARLRSYKNSLHIDLKTFLEIDPLQFIEAYYRPEREKLIIKTRHPVNCDSINIKPVYIPFNESWYEKETASTYSDSILFWIKDSAIILTDSLRMQISHWYQNHLQIDTLLFRFFDTEKATKDLKSSMKISTNGSAIIDPNFNLIIETQYPVTHFDARGIQLFIAKDTLWEPVMMEIKTDRYSKRKFFIKNRWEPEKKYQLKILPIAFENMYGIKTDTFETNFIVQPLENYGILYIQPVNFIFPCIIQLLQKEIVQYETFIYQPQIIKFEFIKPGEYLLKAIFDRDGNMKFTTGDFLKHLQPERVEVYPESIKIRPNWEMEIKWQIK